MIHIRAMTVADLPRGMHLGRQAGWNQTEADWRRFLGRQPEGCFVAEWHGTPAGTTMTTLFGPVAWIAMVLVEETLRGRGIGLAMMKHALAFCKRRGVVSVRLDATPLGKPLYDRLGFVEQFQLARYEGTLPPARGVAGVETARPSQWETLAALDETTTGTDRHRALLGLFAEQGEEVRCVWHGNRLAGFLAARAGSWALYLGPCIADAEAGPLLLADACHRYAGRRIVLDIPEPNETAIRWVEERGLTVQRHLARMVRGVAVSERIEWLWSSSGPEKG
jgi:ribosomal protein S18 acetylase RimI-like enzyme